MIRKINYISHFDKNYLVQGLTLINNLKEKSNFSKIIVVALDDFTKLALLKLNLKDLIVIEISKVLENNNQVLVDFVRFKVGEGIDKKESDFAAEVKDIVS